MGGYLTETPKESGRVQLLSKIYHDQLGGDSNLCVSILDMKEILAGVIFR